MYCAYGKPDIIVFQFRTVRGIHYTETEPNDFPMHNQLNYSKFGASERNKACETQSTLKFMVDVDLMHTPDINPTLQCALRTKIQRVFLSQ